MGRYRNSPWAREISLAEAIELVQRVRESATRGAGAIHGATRLTNVCTAGSQPGSTISRYGSSARSISARSILLSSRYAKRSMNTFRATAHASLAVPCKSAAARHQ